MVCTSTNLAHEGIPKGHTTAYLAHDSGAKGRIYGIVRKLHRSCLPQRPMPSCHSCAYPSRLQLPSVPATPRCARLTALDAPCLGEPEKISVEWISDVPDNRPVWHVVEQAAVVCASCPSPHAIVAARLGHAAHWQSACDLCEVEPAGRSPQRVHSTVRMQVDVPVRPELRLSAVSASDWDGLAAPLWIEELEGSDDEALGDGALARARLADVLVGDLFWSAACVAKEAQWTPSVGEWDKSDCRFTIRCGSVHVHGWARSGVGRLVRAGARVRCVCECGWIGGRWWCEGGPVAGERPRVCAHITFAHRYCELHWYASARRRCCWPLPSRFGVRFQRRIMPAGGRASSSSRALV